jgi:hypothetical protein
MTRQGLSHGWWVWQGIGPLTWEPGPANQNEFFPHKRASIQTELLLGCPGGWSQMKSAGEEAGYGGPGLAWLHVV